MNNDLLERAAALNRAGAAFALATVVRAEKPTSAKPGAHAIITSDGALTGWVGGSCTEHTVLSQALKALRDGEPRLREVGKEASILHMTWSRIRHEGPRRNQAA